MSSIGERIKKLRLEKQLSQAELAKIIGVKNRSSVANYEANRLSPDYEMIIKMANFFNVTTDYLLGVTDDRKHNEYIKTQMKDGTVFNGYIELFDGLEKEDFEKVIEIIKGLKMKSQLEKELDIKK